jgi:Flp pilus assembly protein TadD
MSLLLDALKKAANEKEKLAATEDEVKTQPNTGAKNIEDSVDLDLDLNVPTDNEIYPQIDEHIEVAATLESDIEPADVAAMEDKADSKDKTIPGAESNSNIETEMADDAVNSVQEQPAKDKATELAETDLTADEEKPEPAEKFEPSIQPIIKKQYGIENKQALSELINKSNKYSARKKTRTRIIIVSTVLFVFLLTTAYLYFEFTSGAQNIYMANNNDRFEKVAMLNENVIIEKTPHIESNKKITRPPENKLVASVDKVKTKQINSIVKPVPAAKKQTIKFAQKTTVDPLGDLLRQAYFAFNQGNYQISAGLYRQAIAEEPKNRDALLGLAAIAIKQQRYEFARQKYLQLRRLNPKDSIAIAGLSSVQGKINAELNISDLKFMLHEQPAAAHLYFALGSIYAGQQKWAQAQAEFFSAWSAENTNADYAFNLAVSLDQLGKKTQARQLYKLSLKLNQANKGGFSNEAVAKRINRLSENSD